MNKESLIKAREIIVGALTKSDIDLVDKLELAINLNMLLSENNYDNDIKILRKEHNKKGGLNDYEENKKIR